MITIGTRSAIASTISAARATMKPSALLVPIVIIVVAIALIWLGYTRHRRNQRKHAGLRVLR